MIQEDICKTVCCYGNVDSGNLKLLLHLKCIEEEHLKKANGISRSNFGSDVKIPPELDLLPANIRPQSYELWIWVMEEPKLIGNVTIIVNIDR